MSVLLKPTPTPVVSHRYSVFACEDGHQHAYSVIGESFEDAAMRFIETWHPAIDADGEVFVVVTDCETGRVQSLRVDIGDGDEPHAA